MGLPSNEKAQTMNNRLISRSVISATLIVALASGCGNAAKTKADAVLKKSGVEVAGKGKLPADFPTDLPTPALPLETAVGAVGTFTLRYTSSDAKKDAAAYQVVMEKAGYMLTGEVEGADNFTVTAKKGTSHIAASAFLPTAPGGGNYLAVVFTKE